MNTPTPPAKRKPGPQGRPLEPHADVVLAMWREGKTLREIKAWLDEPPRNVGIARQTIHEWICRRLKKMRARAAAFPGADVTSPAPEIRSSSEKPNVTDAGFVPPGYVPPPAPIVDGKLVLTKPKASIKNSAPPPAVDPKAAEEAERVARFVREVEEEKKAKLKGIDSYFDKTKK